VPDDHAPFVKAILPLFDFPFLELLHLPGKDAHDGNGLVSECRPLCEIGNGLDPLDGADLPDILVGDRLRKRLSRQDGNLLVGAPPLGCHHEMCSQDVGLFSNLFLQARPEGQKRHQGRYPNSDSEQGEREPAPAPSDIAEDERRRPHFTETVFARRTKPPSPTSFFSTAPVISTTLSTAGGGRPCILGSR
jgi:hypothetical protein